MRKYFDENKSISDMISGGGARGERISLFFDTGEILDNPLSVSQIHTPEIPA